MKRLLLLLFLFNFHFVALKGQSMLTIGQVFDFNINDEFQYGNSNSPKNADRIKIIGKHFSLNNDTVFYVRHHDAYSAMPNYTTSPPHFDYTFSVSKDSIFYINLDSLFNYDFINFPVDSCHSFHDTLYNSSQYCGSEVFEYSIGTGCFEGYLTDYIFGKGLGLVHHEYSHPAQWIDDINEMFYYKKGTIICGTPDTTSILSVSIIDYRKTKENLVLYPNPASNILNLTNITHTTIVKLYDMFGKLVIEKKIESDTVLDISQLTQGVYSLTAEDRENRYYYKAIITKE